MIRLFIVVSKNNGRLFKADHKVLNPLQEIMKNKFQSTLKYSSLVVEYLITNPRKRKFEERSCPNGRNSNLRTKKEPGGSKKSQRRESSA